MKIDYLSKLIAVEGDLLEPDLGISEKDRQELIQNVNIVFHSAATVRFDEPVKYVFCYFNLFLKLNMRSQHLKQLLIQYKRTAIKLNVIGTKKVVQLSKSFKNLEVKILKSFIVFIFQSLIVFSYFKLVNNATNLGFFRT